MIEIRPDQMAVFDAMAQATFLRKALAYLRETHGEALREISADDLATRVQGQAGLAAQYGLTAEAEVMQFIEISLAFGDDFHCSARYPTAERILTAPGDAPSKMRALVTAAQHDFREIP